MSDLKTLDYRLGDMNPKVIKAARERFLAINQERMARCGEFMTIRQRDICNVLPVLLHMNHPDLPGYISDGTPSGIMNYSPRRDQIFSTQELMRAFSFFGVKITRRELVGLYLVGRSATVASDENGLLEFWVCYTGLEESRLDELDRKLTAIVEWAVGLDVRLRFRLVDASMFRRASDVVDADIPFRRQYSAATLDWFYRTMIVVAGKYPLWWVIPPSGEAQYAEIATAIVQGNHLDEDDMYDFGPVGALEFPAIAGRALLDIIEGLAEPETVILDLMLAEIYANDTTPMPLSQVLRRAVFMGAYSIDSVDAYVMLHQRVTDYFTQNNDTRRMEVMRRCFYLLASDASQQKATTPARKSWKKSLLDDIKRHWGWTSDRFRQLDGRKRWNLNLVKTDRQELLYELTYSYRFLTGLASRTGVEVLLTRSEGNLVGRKLNAYAERKSNKVDLINPFGKLSLKQGTLSLHHVVDNGTKYWVLHPGHVHGSEVKDLEPLRRSKSVIELLVWALFNGLMTPKTELYVEAKGADLGAHEIKRYTEHVLRLYPDGLPAVSDEDYQRPSYGTSLSLFVNVGADPTKEFSRDGNFLLTEQNDVFAYGALQRSLVRCVDMVVTTTWGEVFFIRNEGPASVVECLIQCLRYACLDTSVPVPAIEAVCECMTRPEAIAARVEESVRSIINCYRGPTRFSLLHRYVIEIEQQLYLFEIKDGSPSVRSPGSPMELISHLGEPKPGYSGLFIEQSAMRRNALKEVARRGAAMRLQVFYSKQGSLVSVYVRDEYGCVFHTQKPYHDDASILKPMHAFLLSVSNRRQEQHPRLRAAIASPSYYEILVLPQELRSEERAVPANAPVLPFHNVQAIAERSMGSGVSYRIFCGDLEFVQSELGDNFFPAVAKYIASTRKSGELYPCYITDLDLSAIVLSRPLSTCDYLRHKERLEAAINATLSASVTA